MGIGGRKPTPAGMIVNDHNNFKKGEDYVEQRREIEKKLQTKATLKCPNNLSPEAKKEWKRVMKLYRGMTVDILNDLDVQPLTMYCEATAIYKKAQETWAKYQSVVVANPEAQRVLDKCFQTMERQSKIVSSLSEQLCLTPVGRARMGMAVKLQERPNRVSELINEED